MKNKRNIIGALIIIAIGILLVKVITAPEKGPEMPEDLTLGPRRDFPTPTPTSTPSWIDEEHKDCLEKYRKWTTEIGGLEDVDDDCIHHFYHWQQDINDWGTEGLVD